MKKASVLLFIVFISFFDSPLPAQTFDWARNSGTSVISTGSAVVTDEKGNSYVTGTFFGECSFGTDKFKAIARDAYLVKYDHEGNVLWAKHQSARGDVFGNALAIDKEGNCYQTGSFAFTMHIGNDSLVSRGQHDIFLAKYNSKGDLVWLKSAGGYYEDHAMTISLDKAGNCYVAGFFKDTMNFSAGIRVIGKDFSNYNLFLAKYDGSGNTKWAKTFGGISYGSQNDGLAIASTPDGMISVTGSYQFYATFDNMSFKNRGVFGAFTAKYNPDGKLMWAKEAGNDGTSVNGKGIAVDKKGNSYVTGTFTSRTAFDSITIETKNLGYPDFFLAKYSPEGKVLWVRTTSGFGTKYPFNVRTDADGNPYVIGTFQDTAIFGNYTLTGKGADRIFIAKYDPKGECVWAKQIGRYGAVLGKDLSFDKQSNIYLTGNFSDTANFGKYRLITLPKTQDVFFAKLSQHSLVTEKKLPDPPLPNFTFISCKLDNHSHVAMIKYSIPRPSFILCEVDDELGNVAESYIESQHNAGTYEAKLDMKALKNDGDYYCRLQAGLEKQTKKIEAGK